MSPVCRLVLVIFRGLNSQPGPPPFSQLRIPQWRGRKPIAAPALAPAHSSRSAKASPAATPGGESAKPAPSQERLAKRVRKEQQREDRGRGHGRLAPTPSRPTHTYRTLSKASIAARPLSECTCTTHFREASASAGRGGTGNAKHHFLTQARRPRWRPFWEGVAFRLPWLRDAVLLFSGK